MQQGAFAQPPLLADVPPLVSQDFQAGNATCPTGEVGATLEIAELLPRGHAGFLVKILRVVQVSHGGENIAENLPLMACEELVEFVVDFATLHIRPKPNESDPMIELAGA